MINPRVALGVLFFAAARIGNSLKYKKKLCSTMNMPSDNNDWI